MIETPKATPLAPVRLTTALGAPMRLVIVDDDAINGQIVAQHLKGLDGLDITLFEQPETALEWLDANRADLIIVDYMMPGIDGLAFIGLVRERPWAEDVPILMITASATTQVLFQAMDIGANDFLGKPIDPVELIARVKNMSKLRSRTLELMDANKRLRDLATTDDLTGLLNRRHFIELGNIELERARRFRKPLSVIMLDADLFKTVNDTHGHAAGDSVLRHLSAVLAESTRKVDLVGRLGGEEFAVVVLESPIEEAFMLAERIRRQVAARPAEHGDLRISITISAGVAELSRDDGEIGDLLNRADRALYQAKADGRNRVMA